MADAFTTAKLKLLDQCMHDGRLTASSRLVFYEIVQHLNRVSGDAWPSEIRLADRLQIDVKTVKRALGPLQAGGYIEIKKRGRHNTYRPVFDGSLKRDKLSPLSDTSKQLPPRSIGDKMSKNMGQILQAIGDKRAPLSYLREPNKEKLSKGAPGTATSLLRHAREVTADDSHAGAAPGHPKKSDPIAGRADDGAIHVLLIQEIGSDAVDSLYAIDDGRPLKMLTALRRERHLTAIELNHARSLIEGNLQREKKRAVF